MVLRGPQSLSDAELVAILLRTGTKGKSVVQLSQELLSETNISLLATKTIQSLVKLPGIGNDKAATLAAAFELSRRIDSSRKWFSNKKISSPEDIAGIFMPLLRDEIKEKFIVVCLNSSNKIIIYKEVTVGILNSSLIHPREVFKVAIDNNAASIILIHNHPSGNPEPSMDDITVTKKMAEAGKILDITVFDHIIIAQNLFTSCVEKGII